MDKETGYGNPPVETRFRKGQSGNPGGRPGPRRALEKRFEQALAQTLASSPEALLARPSPTPVHALAEALAFAAASGNPASIGTVLDILPQPGRRGRLPAWLRRRLEEAAAADAGGEASQQGT